MKTILVTGATAGFGAAMTHRFIAMGHRVIATGRRAQRLDALKAELGSQLFTAAFDIADTEAIRTFVEGLPADWRDIDVLVNNAGLALGLAPAWEAPLSDWDTMIETNIRGFDGGRISLPGGPCLWREQSLRPAIFDEFARRSRRPQRPCERC